ncbi:hypothetical protein [Novosphingobium humi]|uniref:Uncharacterized protein n=1 Tax=Novosphingobium humi TaxID=2282397 RepID=A0ABY7U186_9SPHN|nr:hypothetical protein [Novosphingobium humi]WCT78642.1 hypothetical protein PQ457_06680 [Novosphingobium humi]
MTVDNRLADLLSAQREIGATQNRLEQIISQYGGGGGMDGGMTDDWKTSVNTQLERLHGDVRNLLYGWVGAVVFVLGALSVGYIKLADQSADIKTEQAKQGVRLDNIDKKLDEISAKLDRQK